jgi:hypothetical protein
MSEKKKPSTPNKTGLIARATSSVADRARTTATAARKGAKIAAGATSDAAKVAAQATADFAKKTGKFLDTKSRELLAKEFEKNRPIAVASVARLRQVNGSATPSEIVKLLSDEFALAEKGVPGKSEKFLAAATNYVLALNEIYGKNVRDENRRQLLLYVLLAANSNVAAVVAQVGAMAFAFLTKRFAAVAIVTVVADFIRKNSGKATWLVTLSKLAGMKNVGRTSASWVVVNASLKILGPAPASWPAAAKKQVAKKPAATKPAARKPKPSA